MKRLIFSVFILMFTLSLISASPPNPMAFYGDIIYPGSVPDGYYITAKIGTAIHGQCLIIGNQYGYGENSCIVVSDNVNALINFYIGALEIGSSPFKDKEIVRLNFTLDYLPPRPPILSNGICEPNRGECSFNFLDCHVSLTNACAGNSRCDTEIGETCATTSSDCGVCPTDTSPGGSSGGGGSGGGGGGGSSTFSTTSASSTDSKETTNSGTDGLLNGGSKTDSKTGSNWLTGAVVGAFGETGSIILMIFIILVVASVILFFVMKAKEDKNISVKIKEMMKKKK